MCNDSRPYGGLISYKTAGMIALACAIVALVLATLFARQDNLAGAVLCGGLVVLNVGAALGNALMSEVRGENNQTLPGHTSDPAPSDPAGSVQQREREL